METKISEDENLAIQNFVYKKPRVLNYLSASQNSSLDLPTMYDYEYICIEQYKNLQLLVDAKY